MKKFKFTLSVDKWQFQMAIVMFCSCFLTTLLVGFRNVYSANFTYLFLVTNMILAVIPYLIALVVANSGLIKRSKPLLLLGVGAWLITFPNAPYIITDLMHLRERQPVPLWFDAALLFSAAWNGIMLGFLSLDMIQEAIAETFRPMTGWAVATFSILACSFGIYLGRFLRWNSWDVWDHPSALIADISDRFLNPVSHPRTWSVTFIFTALLLVGYITFRFIKGNRESGRVDLIGGK